MSDLQKQNELQITESGYCQINDQLEMQVSTESHRCLKYSLSIVFKANGVWSDLITIPYSSLKSNQKRLEKELQNCTLTYKLDAEISNIYELCRKFISEQRNYYDNVEDSLKDIVQKILNECTEIKHRRGADDKAFTVYISDDYCNIVVTYLEQLLKAAQIDMSGLKIKRWLRTMGLLKVNGERLDRYVTDNTIERKGGKQHQLRCISIKLDRAEQLGFDVSRLRPEYWEGK